MVVVKGGSNLQKLLILWFVARLRKQVSRTGTPPDIISSNKLLSLIDQNRFTILGINVDVTHIIKAATSCRAVTTQTFQEKEEFSLQQCDEAEERRFLEENNAQVTVKGDKASCQRTLSRYQRTLSTPESGCVLCSQPRPHLDSTRPPPPKEAISVT